MASGPVTPPPLQAEAGQADRVIAKSIPARSIIEKPDAGLGAVAAPHRDQPRRKRAGGKAEQMAFP